MNAGQDEDAGLFSVRGMVAVVTGGGSGLGSMMADILAGNGASKVYVLGRNKEKLDKVAAAHPRTIIPLECDVTSQESLLAAAQHVRADTGHINLLVANAGMAGPGLKGLGPRASIKDFVDGMWSTAPSTFTDVYDLNCTAVFYTILAFLELLGQGSERRRPGEPKSQVIAMSSMAAFMRDPRYGFAYCSSKSAVISMIKSFATYCVHWDVRFNALCPGLFPTELALPALQPFRVRKDGEMTTEGTFARGFIPAERAGSREDLAGVLLYLASKAGSFVNGSVLLMDGGKISTAPATY